MSSRELEERMESETADQLAAMLEITRAELDRLIWEIEPYESDDGTPHGTIVRFAEGSAPPPRPCQDQTTSARFLGDYRDHMIP